MSEPELPEGWPQAFDEDPARDYLYMEASTRLRETIEFGETNNSLRRSPYSGLSLSSDRCGIGAASSGDLYLGLSLLGDSLESPTRHRQRSPRGRAEWGFFCSIQGTGKRGLMSTGSPEWRGADTRAMRDSVLETMVRGFRTNRRITEQPRENPRVARPYSDGSDREAWFSCRSRRYSKCRPASGPTSLFGWGIRAGEGAKKASRHQLTHPRSWLAAMARRSFRDSPDPRSHLDPRSASTCNRS